MVGRLSGRGQNHQEVTAPLLPSLPGAQDGTTLTSRGGPWGPLGAGAVSVVAVAQGHGRKTTEAMGMSVSFPAAASSLLPNERSLLYMRHRQGLGI